MFITFEGLDSSGKSTQIKLLEEKLISDLRQVILIREPGGTKLSEKVREILLDNKNSEMNSRAEFLLFASSRAQLVSEKILPAIKNNIIVLCDRFADSSLAYQGFGRRLDKILIEQINNFATQNLQPDLTFFIDIPIREITRRREIDGKANDRMETVGEEFFERIRNGYLWLAENNKNRFNVLNGLEGVEDLRSKIWKIVSSKL